MKKFTVKNIAIAAMTAALYVSLGFLSNAFGLASGMIQLRLSEMLTVLPFFSFAFVPGITVGCLIFNILSGCILPDILFGTLATLLGAIGTYLLRKRSMYLSFLPPVLSNMCIVPLVLKLAYRLEGAYLLFVVTVGIGEFLSCGVLGILLLRALTPVRKHLF